MKLFSVIIIAVSVVALIGCSSKRAGPKAVEAGQTYYFYPKANVYFDTTANNYLFQDLGGNWQTNAKLPADKQSMLEKILSLITRNYLFGKIMMDISCFIQRLCMPLRQILKKRSKSH